MHIPSAFLTSFLSLSRDVTIQDSPAATNCSVRGYDKGTHLAFLVNSTITAPAPCKSFCSASVTPKCVSFAVGAPGCLLYNVTVDGNVNAMNTSAYTFYDVACTI